MDQIVENAIGSIRVGLEDYANSSDRDDARITSAVRNIFAGILLLAKGKLYALSPPNSAGILIRVVETKLVNGRFQTVVKGKQTIGYDEIKRRFLHFELPLDWDKVDRIHALRNNLEHFYHAGPRAEVRQALADSAVIVRALMELLQINPLFGLGSYSWNLLLRHEQVFKDELGKCVASLASIRWKNKVSKAGSAHFACETCRSTLIRQDDSGNDEQDDALFVCDACGTVQDASAIMEAALKKLYFSALYEAHTRGGELPVCDCVKCGHNTFVTDSAICALCD